MKGRVSQLQEDELVNSTASSGSESSGTEKEMKKGKKLILMQYVKVIWTIL